MSNYNFIAPPVLTGGAQEQIRQLTSYLYRMNENLNVALNNLSPENFVAQTRDMLANGAVGGASSVTMEIVQSQYDALKRMIKEVADANDVIIDELKTYVDTEIGKVDTAVGGYYTPSVEEDGTLTWTPSKEGMPEVQSANIAGPEGPQGQQGLQGEIGPRGPKGDTGGKGDTGASGVYMGPTEPDDSDINVWIDTEPDVIDEDAYAAQIRAEIDVYSKAETDALIAGSGGGGGGDLNDEYLLSDRTTGEIYSLFVSDGKLSMNLHAVAAAAQNTAAGEYLFRDRMTGNTYTLFVSNGVLGMEAASGDGANGEYLLTDRTTGEVYVLYVSDGELTMDLYAGTTTKARNAAAGEYLFADRTTGKTYTLFVSDGLLRMEAGE